MMEKQQQPFAELITKVYPFEEAARAL